MGAPFEVLQLLSPPTIIFVCRQQKFEIVVNRLWGEYTYTYTYTLYTVSTVGYF